MWKDEEVLAVIDYVKNGTSIRKTTADLNVPKSTLGDRINGQIEHGREVDRKQS